MNKLRIIILAAIITPLLFLSTGCSSTRIANSATQTSVSLNKKNYKVLQTGAVGNSYGFRLLGIFPFASANFTRAQANLYKKYEKESGQTLNGRSVAVVDTREDKSAIYFIIASVPRKTVSGNIIEWIEEAHGLAPPENQNLVGQAPPPPPRR